MLVIFGLIVLVVAVIVALIGVLGNTGPTHTLTENFSVLGYHVTGSTGALFLFGIVIGAVAMLGLSVLLAGASRTARRGRDARRDLERSQCDTALANRDRDTLREPGVPRFSRWLRGRQLDGTTDVDATRRTQSRSVLTETGGHRDEHQ